MSVDTLSDSELRRKLMEYGYPVGPVTQTTRKILVKKLKNLIETRGGTGSRHSLAARYSSEDTDDDSSSTVSKKKKTTVSSRRQTLANPMPPPSPVLASSDVNISKNIQKDKVVDSEFKDPIAPDYDGSSTFTTRTVTKTIHKKYSKSNKTSSVTDGLETGSDSDVIEEPIKSYSPSKYLSSVGKSHDSVSYKHNISDQDQIPKSYDAKSRSIHTIKDNKYNEPFFDSNISPIQPTTEDTCTKDNTNQRDLLANYETPFLSEFTRRLSSRSTINLPSTSLSNLKSPSSCLSSNVPDLKEKDSNGHFSSLRSLYSSSNASSRHTTSPLDRPRETMSRTFKPTTTNREDTRNNQNMVSVILVVVLALFFGILAVIYMGLGGKSETFPSLSTDSNIPLCFLEDDLETPGVNCVMKENVDSVLQLLKRLQPILTKKAVSMICDNSSETPFLTDSEIMQMFTSSKVTSLEVKEDLQNAQLLVIKNPKWGISLVDISDDNGNPGDVLDSLDKLFSTRLNGKVGMVITNPELPMKCLIKNKLFTIFSSLLIVSLGLLAAIGMQKLFVWYIRYKKSTEREVFKLVSEIINMVEMHHQNAAIATPGGTQESFLAINHVRDNLIPPKDRKRMAGLWEKAVKFLDENESRIRREVQQVAGEEFHVWRWLPNNNLNKSNTQMFVLNKKAKVWQGQAFETMEGSVNSLTCSPTPCLKIRHMFDADVEFEDDWETKVQDAILEKCGEGVKILHIRVDRGSREGCVYMKCMSQEDAGKAYRALHGCWFDGHLVTVKYLRLERYHERFPDARRCTTPLKPSNNQRLSMQAEY
ncbi:LEM domain-containing inner nuclear membrane protein MAN1 [Megachile rotundata]|uniref:LEM domain-containing inner nuclear membrane protein MAN1 n=1 Tax=Megachile rotundata TaxID=143995 RepID=UPI0006151875|nr:PREDICTED: inner nuclear membrane protein Man1-like [Megachile rotundata]XP_012140095.1 PREDICTED: inner nuclear membrane protein Man1-like [Megachile rotundata]